ncbi:MAG: UDP-N-acetylglucosamine--N-acetylmuramyl-(pentapeptide) pyrophosphoryl-undecaprenol N-acetylglucosamine transferase, partial [Clostridia bacterium]|nr:UDP-N-acetylglucosamine--N-acetylmuramyl-(pentapeptide) pyrophosphoryl-undecaprenol N-acetylglucosamine transferase [Clostridia bacterium]
MRVIVTGGGTSGHVNPALAIANTIKKNIPGSEIIFVGTNRGIENKLVPKAGYKLYHVDVRGIKRSLSLSNLKSLYLAVTSPIKAKKLIRQFKPDVVIGTGGYVCWPVMKAAADMNIPTALHESNSIPGVAIKMLAKHVDRIFVNFEATKNKFPEDYRDKIVRVGNPLRPEFLTLDYNSARDTLGINGKYEKFILSCGGSMGAEKINEAVIALMRDYTSKHPEILHLHATGSIEYEQTMKMYRENGLDKHSNIKVVEYIYDMPEQMAAADLVINRAGAMTLSELAILKKRALLIPSPNVTDNHQYKN